MNGKPKNMRRNYFRIVLAFLAVILSIFNICMSFYLFDLTNKTYASKSGFDNHEDYRLYAIEHGMQLTQEQVDILMYAPYSEEGKELRAEIKELKADK